MSTRSSILIEIPDKYIGETFRYLPVDNEISWKCDSVDDISKEVKISKKYLGIYCHFDGYPNGVGAALVANFNDFNRALNLIIGGDCSCILDNQVRRYATRKGEDWNYLQPRQLDKIEKVSSDSEYLYIFMRGRWHLFENNIFIPLLSDTENYEDYVQGYLDGFEAGESFNQTLRQLDLDKLDLENE